MAYTYRRSHTAFEPVDRPEMDPWDPKPREFTKVIPLSGDNKANVSVQTDLDVTVLPSLPNEKATMTCDISPDRDVFGDMHAGYSRPQSSRSYRPVTPLFTKTHEAGVTVPYNNYYQRLKIGGVSEPIRARKAHRKEPPPPVFRNGRHGAPWRHVRQCTGNLGNHICFIDGGVKQDDLKTFPPYGYIDNFESYSYESPRPPSNYSRSAPLRKSMDERLNTLFNEKARKGFRYWYDEPKNRKLPAKQTISGRLMKSGVGY